MIHHISVCLYIFVNSLAIAQPNPPDVAPQVTAKQTSPQVTTADSATSTAPVAPPAVAVVAAVSEPISIEDSLTMRDPFRKPVKFSDPGNDTSVPELERYGLEQIKIVGIITGPKKPKALISTPSNKMFIVQENDKIGSHKGVIKKIKEKSIIVREKVVNLMGEEENAENEVFYTVVSPGSIKTQPKSTM